MSNMRSLVARKSGCPRLAAIVVTLLILPGCGIPGHRRPVGGSTMPGTYEVSQQWSVPSIFAPVKHLKWEDNSKSDSELNSKADSNEPPEPESTSSRSGETKHPWRVKPTSWSDSGLSHVVHAANRKQDSPEEDLPVQDLEKDLKDLAKDVEKLDKDLEEEKLKLEGEEPKSDKATPKPDDNTSDTSEANSITGTIEPIHVDDRTMNSASSANLSRTQFFNDPTLLGLIQHALANNPELKILNEEIQIACYEVQARSGEYRPSVSLGAGVGFEKPSRFTPQGAVEEQLDVLPGESFPDPLPEFLTAANLSWELDIWHKLRNAQHAASMRYLGTKEGQNYVITRLVAEIAEDYYELLALDNQMETLDRTIGLQQQSLMTAESLKKAGRGTELAVQRFQAEVHKNQSEKMLIHQEIVEVENRINFNLGRYPQPVERMTGNFVELNLHALGAGVPTELLNNRADIREAERHVAAANLDVEVARARFYPSLGLNAGIGLKAFNTKYFFSTPESLIYNVAGDLVAPLINKRAIQAEYKAANAEQLQSVYNYQRVVLRAYTEVVNRIAKVKNLSASIEIKKQQLASLERSVDSASKLFQNARAEYVEVLLAQREFMEARMELIEIKQQQLTAIVNAYQALGGGFNDDVLVVSN